MENVFVIMATVHFFKKMQKLDLTEVVKLFEHRCCDYYEYADDSYTFQCSVCGDRRGIGRSVTSCCGEVTFDEHAGNFGCERCGTITMGRVTDGHGIYQNEYVKDANPQKGRHYRSRIHFYTHLRRYLGDTRGAVPEECVRMVRENIDVNSREAYEDTRKLFKKNKQGSNYRHIFRILYMLGGKKPELCSETIQKVRQDFVALENYFYDNSDGDAYFNKYGALVKRRKSLGKFCRKSMPSLTMLLVILLNKNGHDIFYRIEYLKDEYLRKKVFDFYDSFQRDIISPWGSDEPNGQYSDNV